MSYGVSFGGKSHDWDRWHCCGSPTAKPYDDWVARGRPYEAVFQYKVHYGDNVYEYYLMPGMGLAYIEAYIEFVVMHVSVVARVEFDDEERTVAVESMLCERENYWGDERLSHGEPRSGAGGLGYYRKNVEALGDRVSIEVLIEAFFGPGWALRALPLTRPRTPEELVLLAKSMCPAATGDYRCGPWTRVIAIYPFGREMAATVIQRHFRGWRVRMATAFNPTTPLGCLLELREFRKLC